MYACPTPGGPRIRLKPRRVNGRTVFPLTRQAARHPGLEDRHSTRQSTPSIRAHDGYEWRYVLAGRLRLILGNRDVVLDVVEAAEFDTQLPHWFGSTDQGPAEVVSISAGRGFRSERKL